MEHVANSISKLSKAVGRQLRLLVDLQRLKLVLKLSELFSTFITSLLVWGMLTLIFLLLNAAAAIWLGTLLGASYWGFLVLAMAYLLLLLVFLVVFKSAFKRQMRNTFIRLSFENSGGTT